MKTKIVLWGTDEKEEKVLIGVELLEKENKVKIYTFPETEATEEFYNKMMNIWREDMELTFPDNHQEIERPLSITESILPDNLKTLRSDILNRAKTEWHFVVLSSKLFASYNEEVEEIKEKLDNISEWDNKIWDEMTSFWNKVQKQSREKNLFREHANELRDKTNSIFDKMKDMRKSVEQEFDKLSKENMKGFFEKLEDIEDRIEKGLGLQPIFNELKDLQKAFRDVELNRRDKNNLWKRIDGAFKAVKEKKYGKKQTENDGLSRVMSRYEGLLSAMKNMDASIKRDKKDEEFQQKRIDTTDGQLELQIRQAKLAMILERIQSKEKKLNEMSATKLDLERRIESEKEKERQRKEKEELEKVKESVKEEIAGEIKQAAEERKEEEPKLEKAAQAIAKKPKQKVVIAEEIVLADTVTQEIESEAVAIPSDSEDHIPAKTVEAEAKGEEE